MNTAEQATTNKLIAFTAVIDVLRQLDTPKAKGKYLVSQLREIPYLARYIRYAYDRELEYTPPQMYLSEVLQETVKLLQTKDLKCGLSIEVVNRAFEIVGATKIESYVPEKERLCIEINDISKSDAVAVMLLNGRRVANMVFEVGPRMNKAVAIMKEAGFVFVNRNKI